MALANLEITLLSVKEKGFKNRNYYDLNNIQGRSFFQMITSEFIKFCELRSIDEIEKKAFPIAQEDGKAKVKIDGKKGILSCIIDTGEFGKAKNVAEIGKDEKGNDNIRPLGVMSPNRTVMDPFFCMIILSPLKPKTIFLVTEKKGSRSITPHMRILLRQFFHSNFPANNEFNPSPEFKHYLDDSALAHYLRHGGYKSITFTRHSLPADIAEKYNLGNYKTQDFEIQLSIKAKRGHFITQDAKKKIIDMIDQNPDGFFSYPEFDSIGFDDNNTTVTVRSEYNGIPKNIKIENQKLRSSYEIEVNLDARNNFDFDSIYDKTIDLIKSLKIGIL